ncbi:3D domain-containing protein, partial [Ralstonia pseudosolanacearum]
GMSVGLQSSRGSQDAIQGPTAATNASGTSTASVSTRAQPGQSTISGSSPSNLQTTNQANISWLPARYEHSFLVTCYTLAVEAEAPATPISHNVCGLPSANHYRSKFLTDVKMQGSGQALDGTIVHYRGQGCFNTDTCARTATGACATVGTTIAVDRSVIPKGGSVTVDILGQRKAQDGGGWINGYHIDDYMGPQRAACLQLGTRNSGIVFQSY